ncbi:hypothetical protein [Aeoliella mucimassa]|uniref:Uncharacterized protein n=1 Tax=Aeoliella mucimassa TaxID=2527972 RepID=A0A518AI71_9BACT|nr:hypothetical protein [Aeoliella mucimassa]QDU54428.1 hypothetical protein Pan181_06090 [Aeoliella mucimassa]
MSNATKNNEQGLIQSTELELPPVLARVPWLAKASQPAAPAPISEPAAPAIDASLFQPHSVVAMPELGTTDYVDRAPKYRFDPPQSPQASHEAMQPQPAATTAAPEQPTTTPADTPTAKTITRTAENETEKNVVTHLRFDKAVGASTEPVVEQPEVVEADTHEPSTWHTIVSLVDNAIRQYHRVIVLVALLTAAGLMMLMLQGQGSSSEPAATSNEANADKIASQPEELDLSSIPPLRTDDADQMIAVVRGPQSHSRNQSTEVESVPPSGPIPLEPIVPQNEPIVHDTNAVGPNHIQNNTPAPQPNEGPGEPAGGYPVTRVFNGPPAVANQPTTTGQAPRIARLPGHLLPVNEERQ